MEHSGVTHDVLAMVMVGTLMALVFVIYREQRSVVTLGSQVLASRGVTLFSTPQSDYNREQQ